MVPDGQKVGTDGMDGRSQNYIPPTSSGDKKKEDGSLMKVESKFYVLH